MKKQTLSDLNHLGCANKIKEHQGRPLKNKNQTKTEEISQTCSPCWSRFLCIKRSDEPGVGFPWLSVVLVKASSSLISADWMLWAITALTHFTEFHYQLQNELQLKWLWAGDWAVDVSVTGLLWKVHSFLMLRYLKSARRSTDLLQGNTFFFIHRCTYTWQVWFDYNKLWCDCSVSSFE